MTSLATLANLAQIAGLITVVGGVVFALVQIRQFRLQRRQAGSFEFLRSVQSADFRTAYPVVFAIPDGLSAEEIEARGRETTAAIETINWACETVGVMVHDRALDLATVDRLMGGLVRLCWKRSSPYLREIRRRTGDGAYAEWFQWLAEQLERNGNPRKLEGAYVLYQDWQP